MIALILSLLTAGAAFLALRQLSLALQGPLGARLAETKERLSVRLRRAGAGASSMVSSLFAIGMLLSAGLFYMVSDSLLLALIGAALGAALPMAYAKILEQRQVAAFSGQMPSVLDLMAGSLKSGLSLSQALQTVATEGHQPAASHFAVVSQKLSLGDAPESALDELAIQFTGEACEEELRMLATSVSVTRSSGGNLAEILSSLAETVRERARLRAEIDAMTAQGKLSGWIVGLLPVFILVALNMLDSTLVAPMFNTPLGIGLLALGVVLELIGAFLIKRIVSIDL